MLDFLGAAFFAVLTIGTIGSAVGVVLANRITTSALLMAFAFLNVAGMFVLLGAETVAMFQVLIYVGAITVLILYGVMFTPQSPRPYGLFFQTQKYWAALFVVPIAIFVAIVAFEFRDSTTVGLAAAATSFRLRRASSATSRSRSKSRPCSCSRPWSGRSCS